MLCPWEGTEVGLLQGHIVAQPQQGDQPPEGQPDTQRGRIYNKRNYFEKLFSNRHLAIIGGDEIIDEQDYVTKVGQINYLYHFPVRECLIMIIICDCDCVVYMKHDF